jgi:uncharacterized membrane protein YedE/YeeE
MTWQFVLAFVAGLGIGVTVTLVLWAAGVIAGREEDRDDER